VVCAAPACEGVGQYFFSFFILHSSFFSLPLHLEIINNKEMLQPELKLRRDKIRVLMAQQEIDAALITCNVNLIYTYGRVVSGYLYLPLNAPARLFVKRPNNIEGEHIHPIRKPEQLTDLLKECGLPLPTKLMLEGDELSYTEYTRLAACFPETTVVNGTPIIRKARSIKTDIEIEMFRRSGAAHAKAYERIPSVYQPEMTDRQLSIEIERLMRLEGCLGIFRTFGQSMEIFMGSLLAGDNATAPAPYDFALGGEGLDPSIPIGANGAMLQPGQSLMVDMGGNFNGYMGDMSRVFSIGKLPERAYAAHQTCLEIQEAVTEKAKPGAVCEDLYNTAIDMVTKAGFADYFMGAGQKAKFIGHGIGLEINEAPVLAPRMKQELEPGMVFALEPKIVLPGIGPLGIENSWAVTTNGVEKLTLCKEEIVEL
jgi:Xaa-Pro dipeptidase